MSYLNIFYKKILKKESRSIDKYQQFMIQYNKEVNLMSKTTFILIGILYYILTIVIKLD